MAGKGRFPFVSALGIRFRVQNKNGHPAQPPIAWGDRDTVERDVWLDWFFETPVIGTGQGSQTGNATGSVLLEGVCATAQGDQTLVVTGSAVLDAGSVVTVGVRTNNITTRLYDGATGSLQWSTDHGADVYCVCVDANGNIYTGGVRTGGYTTRKYDINGALQWSVDHGGTVRAIAIGSDGYLYTAGTYNYGIVRKYTSSGTEITSGWPIYHGTDVYGLGVDTDQNLYLTGAQYYESYSYRYVTTRKINSAGMQQWYYTHGTYTTYGISVVDANYVKYVSEENQYGHTGALLSRESGIRSTTNSHGATLYAVAANSTGDYAGARNASNYTTKIASANLDHGATVYAMTVNTLSGSVYTGGAVNNSVTTRKYSGSGIENTNGWPLNHGATVYGIAWTAQTPFFGVNAPALGLILTLGLPLPCVGITPIGLLLPIALGLPSTPQIILPPGAIPSIYRLFVTGTGLLEYPLSALACQRRLGQSTWLVATIPTYSAALLIALQTNLAHQDYLLVQAGIRNSDGSETLGEFLRAILTEINVTRTASRAWIELTGRVINPAFTAQTRTLPNVAMRAMDAGKHTVRCAIDPLLRPNDTVNDGMANWVVGAIDYSISPAEATMTVREA